MSVTTEFPGAEVQVTEAGGSVTGRKLLHFQEAVRETLLEGETLTGVSSQFIQRIVLVS